MSMSPSLKHTGGNAAPCGRLLMSFSFPFSVQSEDSSPVVSHPISMPVTVPVRPRGPAQVCRSGQRGCTRLPPTPGHAALYRSLLHQETAVSEDRGVTEGDGVSGVHYTPPPMLRPLRAGPGLYCSLTTRRQQRAHTVQLRNAQGEIYKYKNYKVLS